MTVSCRGIALIFGALALVFSGAALAQENLDAGKTPAQLFASDCMMCHKSTRGLSHTGGMFGLESFLREHYTASRESAAAIARYLRQVDRGPPSSQNRRAALPRHNQHKATEKNPDDQQAAEKKAAKPGDATMTDKKAGQAASGDKKDGEAKAADQNKDEAKPAPKKPDDAKSAASKPKAMEAEARAAKPAAATAGKPKNAKPVE